MRRCWIMILLAIIAVALIWGLFAGNGVREGLDSPAQEDPVLTQLKALSDVLDDSTIDSNLNRMKAIHTAVGHINPIPFTDLKGMPNQGQAFINPNDAIKSQNITCATQPRTPDIQKFIDQVGCDGKTGNAAVDMLIGTNPSDEMAAKTAVTNLRLLCASAITDILSAVKMPSMSPAAAAEFANAGKPKVGLQGSGQSIIAATTKTNAPSS